jgi:hypothetical protein
VLHPGEPGPDQRDGLADILVDQLVCGRLIWDQMCTKRSGTCWWDRNKSDYINVKVRFDDEI